MYTCTHMFIRTYSSNAIPKPRLLPLGEAVHHSSSGDLQGRCFKTKAINHSLKSGEVRATEEQVMHKKNPALLSTSTSLLMLLCENSCRDVKLGGKV